MEILRAAVPIGARARVHLHWIFCRSIWTRKGGDFCPGRLPGQALQHFRAPSESCGTTYYMIWETPWASAMGVSMWHADYVGDAPACACEDHGHDHDHDDHAAEEAEDIGVVADETETESDGASAGARLAAAAAVVALAAIL